MSSGLVSLAALVVDRMVVTGHRTVRLAAHVPHLALPCLLVDPNQEFLEPHLGGSGLVRTLDDVSVPLLLVVMLQLANQLGD